VEVPGTLATVAVEQREDSPPHLTLYSPHFLQFLLPGNFLCAFMSCFRRCLYAGGRVWDGWLCPGLAHPMVWRQEGSCDRCSFGRTAGDRLLPQPARGQTWQYHTCAGSSVWPVPVIPPECPKASPTRDTAAEPGPGEVSLEPSVEGPVVPWQFLHSGLCCLGHR